MAIENLLKKKMAIEKCIVLVLLLGLLALEARQDTGFAPQEPQLQTCPGSDMVKEVEDIKPNASLLELMIKEKENALMERESLIIEREKLLEEKFKCVTPLQNDIDAIQLQEVVTKQKAHIQKLEQVLQFAEAKMLKSQAEAKVKAEELMKCVMQQQRTVQKKQWQQPLVSLAPHVETLKSKATKGYEVSRDNIKPHLVKAQESLSPHVQTVKDLSGSYVDQVFAASRPHIEKVVAASQPHIEKVTVVLKPYKNLVARAYERCHGLVPQIFYKDRDS